MRSFGRVLAGLFGLALLVLLGMGLVRGPESAESAPPVSAAVERAVWAAVPAEAGDRAAEAKAEAGDSRIARTAARPAQTVLPVLRAGDRNGLPLRAQTWHRAAWNACPPEEHFG